MKRLSTNMAKSHESYRVALGLALLFATVFIVFKSGHYNQDMVWQSAQAGAIPPHVEVKFPPDHLLYGATVRGIWNTWSALGLPGRPHTALQTINGMLGGIVVGTIFLIAFHLSGRVGLSAAFASLVAFIPYVWHHSTDVETYALSKAFQTIAVYLTLLLAAGGSKRRRYLLAISVAIFHAGAALYQYLHVLLVPAVLIAAFLGRDSASFGTRFKTAAIYLVTVGMLVWIPMILVAINIVEVQSISEFFSWLLKPNYGWPAFSRMGWMETPLKFINEAISWPTPFQLPTHEAKLALLGVTSLGGYVSDNWWRFPLLGLTAILQVALLVIGLKHRRSIWATHREPLLVALAIFVPYQLFKLYWSGGFAGQGFIGFLLVMFIMFLVVREISSTSEIERFFLKAIPAVFLLFAVGAFAFSYYPEHDESRNAALQETLAASQQLVAGKDLIVGPGSDATSEYWIYFAAEKRVFWLSHKLPPPESEDIHQHLLSRVDREIRETLSSGGRVYVHRMYANESDFTRPWNEFAFIGLEREKIITYFSRYPHREAFVVGDTTYWEITGAPSDVDEI